MVQAPLTLKLDGVVYQISEIFLNYIHYLQKYGKPVLISVDSSTYLSVKIVSQLNKKTYN